MRRRSGGIRTEDTRASEKEGEYQQEEEKEMPEGREGGRKRTSWSERFCPISRMTWASSARVIWPEPSVSKWLKAARSSSWKN